MLPVEVSSDSTVITIFVPLTVRKRGGRKLVLMPEGTGHWSPALPRVDNTLVKAIARAHRWKLMLDSGQFATVKELAKGEKINASYLSRILRLALLAPDIAESILDGRQSSGLMQDLLRFQLPDDWDAQRQLLRIL